MVQPTGFVHPPPVVFPKPLLALPGHELRIRQANSWRATTEAHQWHGRLNVFEVGLRLLPCVESIDAVCRIAARVAVGDETPARSFGNVVMVNGCDDRAVAVLAGRAPAEAQDEHAVIVVNIAVKS